MNRKGRTLEIEEDLRFQRKEWLFQRVGIAILFASVIAAALGATGMGGPLSHAEAGERGGPLFVEYERVVRRSAKASMKLHFRSDPPGFIQFWVSAPYLADVIVESVSPTPQTVTVEASRHVYTIRAASQPRDVLAYLGYPIVRRLQARCRRESAAAMQRVVN